MAMNKKEQAAMADLQCALAEARALRFTPQVFPDLPAPARGSSGKTSGWGFSANGKNVHPAWSESYAHGHGPTRSQALSAAQGSRPLYSTKLLAFQAMRNALEHRFAGELAQVDEWIAQEAAAQAAAKGAA